MSLDLLFRNYNVTKWFCSSRFMCSEVYHLWKHALLIFLTADANCVCFAWLFRREHLHSIISKISGSVEASPSEEVIYFNLHSLSSLFSDSSRYQNSEILIHYGTHFVISSINRNHSCFLRKGTYSSLNGFYLNFILTFHKTLLHILTSDVHDLIYYAESRKSLHWKMLTWYTHLKLNDV